MELLLFIAIAGGVAWLIWKKQKASEARSRRKLDASITRTTETPKEWRAATWHGPFDVPPSTTSRPGYRMVYANAYGEITERTIQSPVGEVVGENVYVDAWCGLRRERRTFRAERIIELYAPGNDRIYDPIAYFKDLAAQRKGPMPRQVEADHQRAMNRLKPSLNALVWIAHTDRDVDADEMAILKDYARARLAAARGASAIDMHRLEVWIDDAGPTKADALRGLTETAPTAKMAQLFRDYAEKLVASSGTVDASKADRLRQILRAL